MNPRFWLSLAFLMFRIGLTKAAGQCSPVEVSIYGMYLKGHTFKTCQVGFTGECYAKCEEEPICQSYNVVIGRNLCELNSRTKEARPEDFIPHPHRYYMKHPDRAPLGSIPELPAESCNEIKASEGDEMVNKDYWIYSDENAGNATLARCEGIWHKINTDPVCFGARNDAYGAFMVTKTGRVKTMKLVHKSGSIRCNPVDPDSYWGCTYWKYNNKLMTIITNVNKEALLPPVADLEGLDSGVQCGKKHTYRLDGIDHKSQELVFRNLSSPLSLSRNQRLQIWYGQDWVDCAHTDNNGTTCVDVYAWYV